MGIAAVDDHVAGPQHAVEIGEQRVDRIAGLDHHQETARPVRPGGGIARRGDETDPAGHLLGGGGDHLGKGIGGGDGETGVGQVEREIAAHHAETDHGDVDDFDCHEKIPSRVR